jgi:FAD/FMN-containing dehydrogenase
MLLTLILTALDSRASVIVNDVTRLNPVPVEEVFRPESVEEIRKRVAAAKGPVSIGGGRFSMGGQIATEGSLHLDMRSLNRVLKLDVEGKRIRVQAGITWRDIQEVIDPHHLSLRIMQTYSNFTVGGSLSVNVHGRYIGEGPLVRSVESIRIVLADGSLIEASPTKNSETFYGAIGGYGGLGVIVEATLHLTDNHKIEKAHQRMKAEDYADYFKSRIRDDKSVVFQNADLYPPFYRTVNSVEWRKTTKNLTNEERLIPRDQKYSLQPRAIRALNHLPGGRVLRSAVIDPMIDSRESVVWRNREASYDVAELEPPSRERTTFVLQEYFVPVAKLNAFLPKMRRVFQKHRAKVFNVSIRHALPDPGTLLAWAPEEVFALVVYYEQGTNQKSKTEVAEWTRELINEALSVKGRYYLPYQIHATAEQFHTAYPRADEFFLLKKKLDPDNKFRNKLWDKYGMAPYSKRLKDKEGLRIPASPPLKNTPSISSP